MLPFDLGYFSFSFFDTLTDWRLWWVSRYRENTSYQITHVFYRQREVLDALVWLGPARSKRATWCGESRMGDGVGVRMYLTDVCNPQVLSLGEVAQLYGWRISRWLFTCSKSSLRMSHWWRSKPGLILVQVSVVLILSHIVYALPERIATTANCEPLEVSVPLLVELLPQLCSNSEPQFERLVQEGRQLGLGFTRHFLVELLMTDGDCRHDSPPVRGRTCMFAWAPLPAWWG